MLPSRARSPCQLKESQKNTLFWGWHFLSNKLIGFWDGGVWREGPFSRKGLEEVRRKPKARSTNPFLKPPPLRIHLDMSDHAGRHRQAQTGVTAGQLTWDFCGQRHRARQNMMCTDILQCSCRIEHQWRSGGRWTDAAKYDILQKHTWLKFIWTKPDGTAGKDEAAPPFADEHVCSRGCKCTSEAPSYANCLTFNPNGWICPHHVFMGPFSVL